MNAAILGRTRRKSSVEKMASVSRKWSICSIPIGRFRFLWTFAHIRKGEPTTQGRGAIEDALGQACRGANGFAEFCQANVKFLELGRSVSVLPVIFTTAKLYGSKTDIGSADVVSGELRESLQPEEYKWLWCDYPQSPGIKHTIPALGPTDRLDDYFRNVYLRRVAIVSASGISDFLNSQLWE